MSCLKFKTTLKSTTALIDLTPLVDVIFLMLIFFIVTSDILPLKSLNIETPALEKNSSPLTTQLIVVMDAQNVIYVGSKKKIIDLMSLKNQLIQERDSLKAEHLNLDPTLVLSVDRKVEYGIFLKLFSICQEVFPKVRLVYKPSEEESVEYF